MWVHSAQKVNRDHHSRLDDHKKRPVDWLYQDNWWQCGNHFHSFSLFSLVGFPFFGSMFNKKHIPWPIIPFSDTPNSGRFHYIPIFFSLDHIISVFQPTSKPNFLQNHQFCRSFFDFLLICEISRASQANLARCTAAIMASRSILPQVTNEVVINW